MRRKIEWQWEKIDENTHRIKVIGGWIFLHMNNISLSSGNKKTNSTESMCFIADRDHEWTIIPDILEENT